MVSEAEETTAVQETGTVEAVPLRGFEGAPVTAALFATNIGVFAAQVALTGDPRYALGIPDPLLRWLGANASLWTIADTRLETLVTSCFLHASLLHLALNELLLWQVGRLVERSIGPVRFFPLYLATGIAGSATSAIWGRFFGQTLSVGASGAICGLIGAAIVIGVRTEGWKSRLTIQMSLWLGMLLLVPAVKYARGDVVQIDNAAHVGGAIAGVIVASAWRRDYEPTLRIKQLTIGLSVALVAISAVAVFVRDRTDPYLFMDPGQRERRAGDAFRQGDCNTARTAIDRALRMDPQNRARRELANEIDKGCF